MFNQFRSFMQPNAAPQPRPMAPTLGGAIRGMFGGGRGMGGALGGAPVAPVAPAMPVIKGLGQTVSGMAQAPNRTGGLGSAVRDLIRPRGMR